MKYLLLDCNFLCYRAFYSMGALEHLGNPTGVLYGFLRDLPKWREMYQCDAFVFCFDFKKSFRYDLCPTYKEKRGHKVDEELAEARCVMKRQLGILRRRLLRSIGFSNVFYFDHLEADDLIAVAASSITKQDEAVIISADKDLYQLLRNNVIMVNPSNGKTMTKQKFIKEWGLYPKHWATVKAIAGCSSDNIPGVKGVGEVTAAKFVRGELSAGSKYYKLIQEHANQNASNLELVRLPTRKMILPDLRLVPDAVSASAWNEAVRSIGAESLVNQSPYSGSKKRGQKKRKSKEGRSI